MTNLIRILFRENLLLNSTLEIYVTCILVNLEGKLEILESNTGSDSIRETVKSVVDSGVEHCNGVVGYSQHSI